MTELVYFTGVVAWILIGLWVLYMLYRCLWPLWDREICPSFHNLRFAIFGKSRKDKSYYEMWSDMPKWRYRYFTRGNGKRFFGRCAMKRLIREARKESKCFRECQMSLYEDGGNVKV